jgi:arsenate reductase
MINILYLCTGNSCRSQIAEGWTRQLGGDRVEVQSAGSETKIMNEFKATRDEIEKHVCDLLHSLT